MNILFLKSKIVKILVAFAIFSSLTLSAVVNINGQQNVTFAQFTQRSTSARPFVFTNNTTNATFNTVSGGAAIFFLYDDQIAGLPAELQGFQNARMTITSTITASASLNNGNLSQPLDQQVTVQIIRDTATSPGIGTGTRRNLLTAVFTPSQSSPNIFGENGGNSASFSATTPDHVVTFTSDFILFGLTTQRNLGFSFSSVSPSFSLDTTPLMGSIFAESFTASGTGTFASNPVPVYAPPTAASVAVSGRVLSSNGSGLRNAQVVLTDSNGTIRRVNTGSFGNYEFTGIEGGQTVTVSVISKRHSFNAQVISLEQNVSDLNFYAEF